jgi:hypothetical protein
MVADHGFRGWLPNRARRAATASGGNAASRRASSRTSWGGECSCASDESVALSRASPCLGSRSLGTLSGPPPEPVQHSVQRTLGLDVSPCPVGVATTVWQLPKLDVEGSSPFARSSGFTRITAGSRGIFGFLARADFLPDGLRQPETTFPLADSTRDQRRPHGDPRRCRHRGREAQHDREGRAGFVPLTSLPAFNWLHAEISSPTPPSPTGTSWNTTFPRARMSTSRRRRSAGSIPPRSPRPECVSDRRRSR